MGDVGSTFLGFSFAGLSLLGNIGVGRWPPADRVRPGLLAPFLFDSLVTLAATRGARRALVRGASLALLPAPGARRPVARAGHGPVRWPRRRSRGCGAGRAACLPNRCAGSWRWWPTCRCWPWSRWCGGSSTTDRATEARRRPLSPRDTADCDDDDLPARPRAISDCRPGSMFALAGNDVIGVDPSPRVQAALTSGLASIDEPELQTLVTAAINSGRLRVRTRPEAADAFIIAVPTPLDPTTNRADLSYRRAAPRATSSRSCAAATWSCWSRPSRRAPRATCWRRSWPSPV